MLRQKIPQGSGEGLAPVAEERSFSSNYSLVDWPSRNQYRAKTSATEKVLQSLLYGLPFLFYPSTSSRSA